MRTEKVFIIAEAGVNHNGSLHLAKKLVDAAVAAKADAVKFQSFTAAEIVRGNCEMAAYQKANTGRKQSQLEMLKKLELSRQNHSALAEYCRKRKIEFMSTPFDLTSVELLQTLKVKRLKIPSGEITNAPLLLKAAKTKLPIILSTGMARMDEIKTALGVIAFGYTAAANEKPATEKFRAAYLSLKGRQALKRNVTLLHCVTDYPAPYHEVHLRAMTVLKSAFGLPVGYSDHTLGVSVPLAAAALGAAIVEKHFTLNTKMAGPDHKMSLTPEELASMVKGIREIEASLGKPEKKPGRSELKNVRIVRRSLVAAKAIRRGEAWTEKHLTAKRPATGISPLRYWEFLGRPAKKAYAADEEIKK